MRRSVWLVHQLDQPVKTTDRVAARKQIIRTVEDAIQREAEHPDDAEMLHEELMDRLDTPDLEDEIHGRPLDDIIKDIVRDLGLAAIPGTHPWKRRTPDDVAELCARAKQHVPNVEQTPNSAAAWPTQPHRQAAWCNSS